MFDFLFGWRNASKCKRQIKRVRRRLKMLKNKRVIIVRQLREDLAQLIKLGNAKRALNRAEQLHKDENILALYESLDRFCEFIISRLSYIRRTRDCPSDINEAVSTLIFASARCGELPELCLIRKLFADRYGPRFTNIALEFLPGNFVNFEVKEKLSTNLVPDDVKLRLADEIARQIYPAATELLALQDTTENVKEDSQLRLVATDARTKIEESRAQSWNQNPQVKPTDADSISITQIDSLQGVEVVETCLQVKEDSQLQLITTDARTETQESRVQSWNQNPQVKRTDTDSIIITLIDSLQELEVVETCLQVKEAGQLQLMTTDARTEIEESRVQSCNQNPKVKPTDTDPISITQLDSLQELEAVETCLQVKEASQLQLITTDAWTEIEDSRVQSWNRYLETKATDADSNSLSFDSLIIQKDSKKELEITEYCENSPQLREGTSMVYLDDIQEFKYSLSKDKSFQDQRIFIFKYDDDFNEDTYSRASSESSRRRRRKSISSSDYSAINDTDCRIYYNKQKRKQHHVKKQPKYSKSDQGGSCYIVYNIFSYPNPNEETDSLFNSKQKASMRPYLRTATMPQERSKESCKENIMRSNSCSFRNPNHVHPKLPDYDDIAAKFLALKKERLLNKY